MGGNIDMWEEYGNTRKLDNLIAGHLIAPIEAGWLAHSPSYQFCRLNLRSEATELESRAWH